MGLCWCFSGQGIGRGEQVLSCQHSPCFPRGSSSVAGKPTAGAELSRAPLQAVEELCHGYILGSGRRPQETLQSLPLPPAGPWSGLSLSKCSGPNLGTWQASLLHFKAVTPRSTCPALCLLHRETGSSSSPLLSRRLNTTGRLSSTGRWDRGVLLLISIPETILD